MKYIYLLSSDGYRDSIDLTVCADSLKTLKQMLINSYYEYYGDKVIPDSLIINQGLKLITFKYTDSDDLVTDGRCYYFKIEVVR